MFKKW